MYNENALPINVNDIDDAGYMLPIDPFDSSGLLRIDHLGDLDDNIFCQVSKDSIDYSEDDRETNFLLENILQECNIEYS
jgi:hypothetical protein